jgi:hypothetical protein
MFSSDRNQPARAARFVTTASLAFTMIAAAVLVVAIGSAQAAELRGRVVSHPDAGAAVVWIEGIPGSAVPDRDTVIDHVSGKFEPKVAIGFVGNEFVLRNQDDTLHNTHFYLRQARQAEVSQRPLEHGQTLFNVALPSAGADEVRKPIKSAYRYRDETGFIEVVCNRHPGETAYVLVFDHPFAVVTDKDGSFAIPDVPAGNHQVRVWQSGAVTAPKLVEVSEGTAADVVIEMGSAD